MPAVGENSLLFMPGELLSRFTGHASASDSVIHFRESLLHSNADGLEDDGITIDDIEAAAKQANAHDFIMAFPRGYRTMVTDKCALNQPPAWTFKNCGCLVECFTTLRYCIT